MNKNIKDNNMEHNDHFTTQKFDKFTITLKKADNGEYVFESIEKVK